MWLILVVSYFVMYLGHMTDLRFCLIEILLNLACILLTAWGMFELRPESKLPADQPGKTEMQKLRLLAGLECLRTGALLSWIFMVMTIASEPAVAGFDVRDIYMPLLGMPLPFIFLLIFEAVIRFRLNAIEVEFPDSVWRKSFCLLSAFMLILIGIKDETGDSWGVFAITCVVVFMVSSFISGFKFFRQGRRA